MADFRRKFVAALGLALLVALVASLFHVPHVGLLVAGTLGMGLAATTVLEPSRYSDVLLYEAGFDVNFVRDTITLVSGTPASKRGQVLGQITIGSASRAAKAGGNTGAGSLTLDVTTPVLANAKVGVYTVRCITASVGAGTFRVTDPLGRVLGDVAAAATFADQVKFVIAASGADFVVGDGFDITIAAGSGKYTQVAPAAVDGSAIAAAVLLEPVDASSADAQGVAVVRGPAVVKSNGLVWTSGMTSGQKTTALTQLAALSITSRGDYGA